MTAGRGLLPTSPCPPCLRGKFFLFLCLLLASSAALASDPPKDPEAEAKRLAQQVGEIASKQMGILDRLDLLRRRVRLAESVSLRIQREQEALRKAEEDAVARLAEISAKEKSVRRYLDLRMRQQYALGVLQQYRVYFAVNSTQDLRAAGFYLQVLAARDAESLGQLAGLMREQEAARRERDTLRVRLDEQGRRALAEKRNLVAEQAQLSILLNRLGQERQAVQQGIDETAEAAKRMDRYVTDLDVRPDVETQFKNMATAQGDLPLPCPGSVVKGFGDTVHPRFRTKVPHPGLDIAAPLGAPVSAVYGGQVEYADWLSGYGYTVILSHPGGYYTIYSHLDQVKARKGETVRGSQVIGAVGQNATTGSTALYFELRQGGRAVDPQRWLKGAGR